MRQGGYEKFIYPSHPYLPHFIFFNGWEIIIILNKWDEVEMEAIISNPPYCHL